MSFFAAQVVQYFTNQVKNHGYIPFHWETDLWIKNKAETVQVMYGIGLMYEWMRMDYDM